MFKKMHVQKRREQIKEYEKQEKRIKELKAHGQSKKAAEKKQKEALTRKQEKGRSKGGKNQDNEEGPQELLERPKEYIVKFRFPDPPPLQPPILGLHSKTNVVIGKLFIPNAYFYYNFFRCQLQLRQSAATVHQDRIWYWSFESYCYCWAERCGQIHILETVDGWFRTEIWWCEKESQIGESHC